MKHKKDYLFLISQIAKRTKMGYTKPEVIIMGNDNGYATIRMLAGNILNDYYKERLFDDVFDDEDMVGVKLIGRSYVNIAVFYDEIYRLFLEYKQPPAGSDEARTMINYHLQEIAEHAEIIKQYGYEVKIIKS